jgi:hypothetical protein
MLKHLRQIKLPEEAQSRGLHALAEHEAAQILSPIKASLFRLIENQLSEANPRALGRDRNLNRNAFDDIQPGTPQLCQPSAGKFFTILTTFAPRHLIMGHRPPLKLPLPRNFHVTSSILINCQT